MYIFKTDVILYEMIFCFIEWAFIVKLEVRFNDIEYLHFTKNTYSYSIHIFKIDNIYTIVL